MTLTQLHYFCAVAKHEHMSKAAEELNVAQSSLSLAVKHLESELGIDLFERKGRSIQLSQYGRAFYEDVLPVLDRMQSAVDRLARMKNVEDNSVYIRSPSLIGYPGLMERLDSQGIALSILSPSLAFPEVVSELIQHKIDLAIIIDRLDNSVLNRVELTRAPMMAYMSVKHPLAQRKAISLEELSLCSFAAYPEGTAMRRLLDSFFDKLSIIPHVSYEGTSVNSILGALVSGKRVALLSDRVAVRHSIEDVVAIPVSSPDCVFPLYLYWVNNPKERAAVRVLRKEILDYFQNQRDKEPQAE